ncbi:MAG: NERD domain-containing protein [Lachnospiraceae bacterium]|nr:NERD domain-containing protein [Lachnospiraceae bacterium]
MISNALRNLLSDIFPQLDPGKHGEDIIESIIQKESIQSECYIKNLRNLYICNDKYSTEIDLVAITEKGIFVIESKNYGGWIFGDLNSEKWMQTLQNGSKHQFYNPLKQNENHRRKISKFLDIDVNKTFSYIVFASRSEFKKIPEDSSHTRIIHCNMLENTMKKDLHYLPNIFTKDEIDCIYNKLLPLIQVSEEEKQKHIEYVKKFSEGKECPVCGNTLELSEYKNGLGKYKCTKCSFERTDNIDIEGIKHKYKLFRNENRNKNIYEDFVFGNFFDQLKEAYFRGIDELFGLSKGQKNNKSVRKKGNSFFDDLLTRNDYLYSERDWYNPFGTKGKNNSSYKSRNGKKKRTNKWKTLW